MITINIDPIIFSVRHRKFRWYGLIIMTAILAAVWLATRESKRKVLVESDPGDATLWVVLAGLLGAMVPQLGVYSAPTPVFDIVMSLATFAVLRKLRTHRLLDGAQILIYLVLYAVGRFALSFLSAYQTVALGLNQAQQIAIVGFIVGVPALAYLLAQRHSQAGALAGR